MSSTNLPTRYPNVLRPGDAIALVSPAGPVPADKLEAAVEVLKGWGLRPRVYPHALDRHSFYAGTDADRLADLNAALADPQIRGVFCNRGGYGVQRIVEQMDFAAVRRDPKVLIGFSDITALHTALWTHAGVASVHGPVSTQLDRGESFTRSIRHALMTTEVVQIEADAAEPNFSVRTGGRAQGLLLGGNLTMLSTSIGTPFMPDLRGAILLIEDVGEAAYRVDRMLTQLGNCGILQSLAGIAIGQFTEPTGAGGVVTPADVLRERLCGLGIPVLGGLPIGHGQNNIAVPLGTEATLDAERGTLVVAPAVR